MIKKLKMATAGALAGVINGLFGAGGGMVLVPLLGVLTDLSEEEVFPSSVSIIAPLCVVSLAINAGAHGLPLRQALPYLLGSIGGGIAAVITGNKIPVKWLHRILGAMIVWGGVRYLCR